jgi:hypothetical protein
MSSLDLGGLIFGPLLAAAFIGSGLSQGITCRVLLAFGAVPAMAVFQMRRRLAETPRYLLAAGQHQEFTETANHVLDELEKRGARHLRLKLERKGKSLFGRDSRC